MELKVNNFNQGRAIKIQMRIVIQENWVSCFNVNLNEWMHITMNYFHV